MWYFFLRASMWRKCLQAGASPLGPFSRVVAPGRKDTYDTAPESFLLSRTPPSPQSREIPVPQPVQAPRPLPKGSPPYRIVAALVVLRRSGSAIRRTTRMAWPGAFQGIPPGPPPSRGHPGASLSRSIGKAPATKKQGYACMTSAQPVLTRKACSGEGGRRMSLWPKRSTRSTASMGLGPLGSRRRACPAGKGAWIGSGR